MRIAKWLGAAPALLLLFSALAYPDGNSGQRFDIPGKYGGRPMTSAESTTVQRAIDSIGLPPPDTITFVDENGDTHTVSCWTIAWDLEFQFWDSGGMEVETIAVGSSWTLPDCLVRTDGDQMNIDPGALARAAQNDSNRRILEGILVHEWVHKTQDTASLKDRTKAEIEPYSAMGAYYCSTRVRAGTPGNDWLSKWAKDQWVRHGGGQPPGNRNPYLRPYFWQPDGNYYAFLNHDSIPAGSDSLVLMAASGAEWNSYPLAPLTGSDLVMFPSHPFLPPGHSLAMVCGWFPLSGVSRILLLQVFQGRAMGPVMNHDFGPPAHSPMHFYAMTRSNLAEEWYMLDTLNHQILRMQDAMFGDGVPDEISGVFADGLWPEMADLLRARGIEAMNHPSLGAGLMLLDYDVHFYDAHYPYDGCSFLMDTDGNLQADACLHMPFGEFVEIHPVILGPEPWPGEQVVQLFATWEHDLSVWTTDPGGESFFDLLGTVHMAPNVHAYCVLSRPLLMGEHIMAFDETSGHRSWPPEAVTDPSPSALTLQPLLPGILLLNWTAVPGATGYLIYASENGVDFFDTGLRTEAHSMILPYMGDRMMFRVTAEKTD